MVRVLDTSLTATLAGHTRRPALALSIEDHVLHYSLYQTPATVDGWNDACSANDNSIVRILITRGGSGYVSNAQVQRVSDPSQTSQWQTWTTLPGATGTIFQDGGCAIANNNGTLRAYAQRGTGGNELWVWTSTNNGVNWTGPTTVLAPAGGALLKGISSAGNNDVFFLYDVSGGEAIGCSFFRSASWSALTTWTLPSIAAGAGLAVTWNGSSYTVMYSDSYTLFSCGYTPSSNTWNSNPVIAPATNSAIGRISPRLSLMDGLYTLTCIEADSGLLTGMSYSYPRLRQSSDLLHWSNGGIAHDLTAGYGVMLLKVPVPASGNAGARYYLASPVTVYSAPIFQSNNATQALDVSASILAYQRHEQVGKPARLEVIVDNAKGVYNNLITSGSNYQPLGLNASLILSEGYMVGTAPMTKDVLKVGTYHITQLQIVRSPQENKLILVAFDLLHNLALIARYQNTYTNQTIGYLLTEICARAGLFSVSLPQTGQINQTVPSFVLRAGQSYQHALDELCTTYGLYYFLDQNETVQFRELASSDSAVWSYQSELESCSFNLSGERANHIIVTGKPPTSGVVNALTTAEAYDDAHLHLVGLERLRYHVDPKLTSIAQCSQKATFLMAQETRLQGQYGLTVPLNPALQLLDVLSITDSAAPTGSGQSASGHIVQLQAIYDAHSGSNELHVTLEGM